MQLQGQGPGLYIYIHNSKDRVLDYIHICNFKDKVLVYTKDKLLDYIYKYNSKDKVLVYILSADPGRRKGERARE